MSTLMMTRVVRAGLVALLLLPACDSADPLGPLVILTNAWRDVTDDTHTFLLNDDTGFEPKRSGTFTGTETLPDATQYQLEGFWTDRGKVEFTVHRASNVTYRGTLSAATPDRIDFTSSAGSLTLVRN
ncbi:MAG TPA: hypothetical protein VF021_02430 [Longimicrobiales bacterium]